MDDDDDNVNDSNFFVVASNLFVLLFFVMYLHEMQFFYFKSKQASNEIKFLYFALLCLFDL